MNKGEIVSQGSVEGQDPSEFVLTGDYTGLDGGQRAQFTAPDGRTVGVPRETGFPSIDQAPSSEPMP